MHGRLSDAFGHYLINPLCCDWWDVIRSNGFIIGLEWTWTERGWRTDTWGSGLGLSRHISVTLPTYAVNHETKNPGEQSGESCAKALKQKWEVASPPHPITSHPHPHCWPSAPQCSELGFFSHRNNTEVGVHERTKTLQINGQGTWPQLAEICQVSVHLKRKKW